MSQARVLSAVTVLLLGLLASTAVAASDEVPTCVVALSASLDSAVLIDEADGEETVVSTPRTILFVGGSQGLKAVVSVSPTGSPDSFVSLRFSLSNISFSLLQTGGLTTVVGNPSSLVDLEVDLEVDDDVLLVPAGQPLGLELEFAPEDGLQPDGSGCFTGDFVADPAVAFEAELEDEAEQEFGGEVVSVGTSDFVLNVAGFEITIAVDANTEFEDLTGLTDLSPGDLVKVEVSVQPDGSFLAKEVESKFDEDDNNAKGRIVSVDFSTGPATSVEVALAPSKKDRPFGLTIVQVNLLPNTKFRLKSRKINTSGFVFDASNLSPGQRVKAKGTSFLGATGLELDAQKLRLLPQNVVGTVVAGSVDTTAGTFQLNVTSPTGAVLSGPLLVRTDANTRFAGKLNGLADLNTTNNFKVTGLLLRNGPNAGDVIFLAKKVKRQR